MLGSSGLTEFFSLPIPVILIAFAFVLVGVLISVIGYRGIRKGEVWVRGSIVRRDDDPVGYYFNVAFTIFAVIVCFYIAHLIYWEAPAARADKSQPSESADVQTPQP